jgi:hypothetical protein
VRSAVITATVLVAALNALAGLAGSWWWYRQAPQRLFWVLLRIGQGSALVLALGTGALALAGRNSTEGLFYLYALLPLAVAFMAEQLRLTSAQTILDQSGLADAHEVGELAKDRQQQLVQAILRREMGVMAVSAWVVVFLALRAAGTAHGF